MVNTSTRKLVRQEWKPLGGRRVTRFVAMPAGASLPAMEWTDDLPGAGEVVNDVIGYGELEAHMKFPGCESFEAFVEALDEDAEMVMWRGDWEAKAEAVESPEESANGSLVEDFEEATDGDSADTSDESDPDPSDEDEAPEDAPEEPAEDTETEPVTEEELIVVSDDAGGREEVAYDADDEPYRLPRYAGVEDLRMGVVYMAKVVDVKGYGFFISVCDTQKEGRSDVSGLVHKSNLGLKSPREFDVGDTVTVEVENMTDPDEVSFIPHTAGTERGIDTKFPAHEETHD